MNSQQIGETYRQIGAQGADPLELVVMLYDVLLDDLGRAIQALREHDIEKRTAELQHALRILEQLQGALDMERGGEPARNLDRLYSKVRAKLIEAQWKSSAALLESQIELLRPVRDAWRQARTQQAASATASDSSASASPDMPPPDARPSLEFRV